MANTKKPSTFDPRKDIPSQLGISKKPKPQYGYGEFVRPKKKK